MRSRNKRTRTTRTSRRYSLKRRTNRKRTNRKISRKRTNRKISRKRTNRKRTNRKVNRLIGGTNKELDPNYPKLYHFNPVDLNLGKEEIDNCNRVKVYFAGGENHGLIGRMLKIYQESRTGSNRFTFFPKKTQTTGIIKGDDDTSSIDIVVRDRYNHMYHITVKLSDISSPMKGNFPRKGFYIELTDVSLRMRNEVKTRATAEKEREAAAVEARIAEAEQEEVREVERIAEAEQEELRKVEREAAAAEERKAAEAEERKAAEVVAAEERKEAEVVAAEERKAAEVVAAEKIKEDARLDVEKKAAEEAEKIKTAEAESGGKYINKLKEIFGMVEYPGKIFDIVIESKRKEVEDLIRDDNDKSGHINCRNFKENSKWIEIIEDDNTFKYVTYAGEWRGGTFHKGYLKDHGIKSDNVCKTVGVSAWYIMSGTARQQMDKRTIIIEKSIGLELSDLKEKKEQFNNFEKDLKNDTLILPRNRSMNNEEYKPWISQELRDNSRIDDNTLIMDHIVNLIIPASPPSDEETEYFYKTGENLSSILRADELIELIKKILEGQETKVSEVFRTHQLFKDFEVEQAHHKDKDGSLYKTLYFNKLLAEIFTKKINDDILYELDEIIKDYKAEEIALEYGGQQLTKAQLMRKRTTLRNNFRSSGDNMVEIYNEWVDKIEKKNDLSKEINRLWVMMYELQKKDNKDLTEVIPFDQNFISSKNDKLKKELEEVLPKLNTELDDINGQLKKIEEDYPQIVVFKNNVEVLSDLIESFQQNGSHKFHHEYITQLKDNLGDRLEQLVTTLRYIVEFIDKFYLNKSGEKLPYRKDGVEKYVFFPPIEEIISDDKKEQLEKIRSAFDKIKENYDKINPEDILELKSFINEDLIGNLKEFTEYINGDSIFDIREEQYSETKIMLDELFLNIRISDMSIISRKVSDIKEKDKLQGNDYNEYQENIKLEKSNKKCNDLKKRIDDFYEKRKKQALERMKELDDIKLDSQALYRDGSDCMKVGEYIKKKKKEDGKLNKGIYNVSLSNTIDVLLRSESNERLKIDRDVHEKFKGKQEREALRDKYPPQLGTPKLNSKDLLTELLDLSVKDLSVKDLSVGDIDEIEYETSDKNNSDFGFGESNSSTSGGGGPHKRKIRTIQNIKRKFNRN